MAGDGGNPQVALKDGIERQRARRTNIAAPHDDARRGIPGDTRVKRYTKVR
jgi:hypothetical protein